jgi:hypothetical protein
VTVISFSLASGQASGLAARKDATQVNSTHFPATLFTV